jgi:uncharacterized protein (DUF736 family)
MATIGTFTRAKDGGWQGTIRTLSKTLKARFVPNDDRRSEAAADFHIVTGPCDLGAAWIRRKNGSSEYLSVQLDDPLLSRSISAALFYDTDSAEASLVWRRDDGRASGQVTEGTATTKSS